MLRCICLCCICVYQTRTQAARCKAVHLHNLEVATFNTFSNLNCPTDIDSVLFLFYILGIGLMMTTEQSPKHVADFLSREVVF